jgi:hypothetical protein
LIIPAIVVVPMILMVRDSYKHYLGVKKYYPNGYIDDAGARSLTGIIVLLTAIGIALVAYLGVRTKFD